jgi:hypothetical protein
MNNLFRSALVTAGILFSVGAQAQTAAPAAATPAAVTAVCKDSTSFSGTSKRGACSGHGGVESWGTTTAAAAPAAPPPTGTAAATTVTATCKDETSFSGSSKRGACSGHGGVKSWGTTTASATQPMTPAAPAAAGATAAGSTAKPSTMAAKPGGGVGQVWVNTSSKVYHCSGSRWYGKTKQGEYMTEAAAKSEGFRAAQSKTCS